MVLRTKVWDGRQFCYSFTGWRVRSTGTLLPYEEPLTLSVLYQYATNGVVELEAVWSPVDRVGNIQSINFYVNLSCEIMDFGDNGYVAHPQNNFTQSVFNSHVSTTGQNSKFASDFQLLAPPTSEETAYEVDGILRDMATQTYRGFTLEDFPTDGEIFAQLRAKNTQIYLDGQAIPMRYLSPDYFQIRWYVMKYDMSDGWHIDGILVAKTAKLNVTKSFMGDAATIAEIKSQTGANEFTIKVTDNRDAGDAFYLTLNPWEEELYRNDQNYYGYHSYDSTTDTYTWNLEGHLDGTYTVTENNYLSENMSSVAFYRIYEAANSQDWQAYPDAGITVQMRLYPEDEPVKNYQTVALRNYYVNSGDLRLHKIDSFTHDSIGGVAFKIQSANDRLDLQLRQKPGTSMYSALDTEDSKYTQDVRESIITTDANGDLFLRLLAGTYVLTESFPDGYSGAEEIVFTVDGSGCLTQVLADGRENTALVSGTGSNTLTVQNLSRLLTTVTAQKDWGGVPEERQEDVIIRLMANGVTIFNGNEDYTQTLNAANNWTYTWTDLPLFMDGELAEYTIREMQIGDVTHDSGADATDGYRDYQVSYEPALYREGDSGDYSDKAVWMDAAGVRHYANHVLLTVHNRIDGLGGEIRVTKAFRASNGSSLEKIDGVYTFGLFDNPEGSGRPASITYASGSNEAGGKSVVFTGLAIGQSYYVFELGDDGNVIPGNALGTIGRRSFYVLGCGEQIVLTSESPNAEVTITNRMNYEPLPSTGGIGAAPYAVGALLVLLAACLLYGRRKMSAGAHNGDKP